MTAVLTPFQSINSVFMFVDSRTRRNMERDATAPHQDSSPPSNFQKPSPQTELRPC